MVDTDGDPGTPPEQVDIDTHFSGWQAGALFVDEDGFPIYDAQERVIGDPNPDWLASIRNTFRIYRNLRVSFLIDHKQGGEMWNGTKGALFYFGTHGETLQTQFSSDVVDCYQCQICRPTTDVDHEQHIAGR